MLISAREVVARICAGATLFSLATSSAAPAAGDKTYVMKIALATVDDPLHEFAKNYAAALEKDSNGRGKSRSMIYPSSQLGATQSGKPRACNLAKSNAWLFRRNFSPALMNVSKSWRRPALSNSWPMADGSPLIRRCAR